jgi:hypothetical protein
MTTIARKLAFAFATLTASACVSHVQVPRDVQDRVLAQYAHGASLDAIAADFRLGDRAAARDVVHDAMLALQKRYYADR